ncbi:hypothetical protein ABIA33_006022 [Streptacidiphilus sp. MAP12-16]|uniref:phosphodiester glycosidase family protein n=1 Tax=Streptacidiphilus sp. MAP12-16 TaxID=3156300 RepID=UPI003510EF44
MASRNPRTKGLARWSTLLVAVTALGLAGYCVNDALAAPGDEGTIVKLAHWGRCHELDTVADLIERPQPGQAAQCVMGDVSSRAGRPDTGRDKTRPEPPSVPVLPMHAPVPPLVSPAQPGEGVFSTLVTVKGQPVVQSTTMRPDATDLGFPVGVAWMRHSALRFELHPGVLEPGGSWPVPPSIAPGRRTGLVATFNGGFKVSNGDSHGGFYLDGNTVGSLRSGAASEVFHRDGSITIGVWNRDVGMAADVVGVRQCLVPLVDQGRVTDAVYYGGTGVWGLTDGGFPFVARSGVGIDRNGDIIYVGGRLMSVSTLATTLQRAGAVTAMMLDINISWPSFISYDGTRQPSDPVPHNLVNFVRAPTRYYEQSSKDFVAVYAR